MQELLRFTITGIIPSKKNSKRILRNRKTGRPYIGSSKEHDAWIAEHVPALQCFCPGQKTLAWPLHIEYIFRPIHKYRFDLSNKIESINDLLVDAGIIEDDNHRIVYSMKAYITSAEGQKEDEMEVVIFGI